MPFRHFLHLLPLHIYKTLPLYNPSSSRFVLVNVVTDLELSLTLFHLPLLLFFILYCSVIINLLSLLASNPHNPPLFNFYPSVPLLPSPPIPSSYLLSFFPHLLSFLLYLLSLLPIFYPSFSLLLILLPYLLFLFSYFLSLLLNSFPSFLISYPSFLLFYPSFLICYPSFLTFYPSFLIYPSSPSHTLPHLLTFTVRSSPILLSRLFPLLYPFPFSFPFPESRVFSKKAED